MFVVGKGDAMSASQCGQSDDAGAAAQLQNSSACGPVGLQDCVDHGDGCRPDKGPVGHAVITGSGSAGGWFIEQCVGVGWQQQLPCLSVDLQSAADPATGQWKRPIGGDHPGVLFRPVGNQFGAEVDGSGNHREGW